MKSRTMLVYTAKPMPDNHNGEAVLRSDPGCLSRRLEATVPLACVLKFHWLNFNSKHIIFILIINCSLISKTVCIQVYFYDLEIFKFLESNFMQFLEKKFRLFINDLAKQDHSMWLPSSHILGLLISYLHSWAFGQGQHASARDILCCLLDVQN